MLSFSQYLLTENLVLEPNTQYGTNEGGVHTNTKTGKRHYVKYPKTSEQAKVEAATSDLYNELGIKTLNPSVKVINGKTAVVTDWQDNLHTFNGPKEIVDHLKNPENAKQLALIHHAAIITNNNDVIGDSFDNILRDKNTGDFVSIDQGGAMNYRAQGKKKAFDKNINQVEGFKNPVYLSSQVFSHLDPRMVKEASQDLQKLTDDKIDSIMKSHRLEHLADVLKSRRDMLISHYRGV